MAREKPPIEVKNLAKRHVASVRTTSQQRRLRHTVAVILELVMDAVGQQGLAPADPLFTRYHWFGPIVELECGLPLAQPITPMGVVLSSSLPGGPTLHAIHAGKHEQLPELRAALEAYGDTQGYRRVGAPWECYLIDGRDTPDETEWLTDIYVPVSAGPIRPTIRPSRPGRMALASRQAIGEAVRPYRAEPRRCHRFRVTALPLRDRPEGTRERRNRVYEHDGGLAIG